jgi:hypothetical protein
LIIDEIDGFMEQAGEGESAIKLILNYIYSSETNNSTNNGSAKNGEGLETFLEDLAVNNMS